MWWLLIPLLVLAYGYSRKSIGEREPISSSGVWDSRLAKSGKLDRRFLAKWLAMESGGNPCKIGEVPGPDGNIKEAGIGQVYFDHPGDVVFGVKLSELRAACGTGSTRKELEAQLRPLSEKEKDAQFNSFLRMAQHCYDRAASQLLTLGLEWDDSDIYKLAKLYHGVPAVAKAWLPIAKSSGFEEFWRWSLSHSGNNTRVARAFDNANRCGSVVEDI